MDFMQEAVLEAEKNLLTGEGGPFGAVIVKDNEIIARGHNRVLVKHDPTCHAEIEAIREAASVLQSHDLTGCELYTSCYPCPMCLAAAIWANIKVIYYGNTAEDAAAIGFRDDYIYDFIEKGKSSSEVVRLIALDRERTIGTFDRFMALQDKKLY